MPFARHFEAHYVGELMPESWQRTVNGILFKVQFEEDLGNQEVVDWLAENLIKEPLGSLTPDEEIAILATALGSGLSLTEEAIPQPHSEQQVRLFLTVLLDRMKALRR
jgi:hypothetical protein